MSHKSKYFRFGPYAEETHSLAWRDSNPPPAAGLIEHILNHPDVSHCKTQDGILYLFLKDKKTVIDMTTPMTVSIPWEEKGQ
jgi:hypothetical protein